jgi:hypothetical protein
MNEQACHFSTIGICVHLRVSAVPTPLLFLFPLSTHLRLRGS